MQTQKVDKKYYKQADQNKKRGNNQEISGQSVLKRNKLEGKK
jgi:hypothetical protein